MPDVTSADQFFRARVTVEGSVYEGQGTSKKLAKVEAANLALDGLKTLGLLTIREQQLTQKRQQREVQKHTFMHKREEIIGQRIMNYRTRERKHPPLPKNAAMKLNEHHKGLEYDFSPKGGSPWAPHFNVQVTVQGKVYSAQGNTKKNAKLAVAENVLKDLGLWTDEDERVKEEFYVGPEASE